MVKVINERAYTQFRLCELVIKPITTPMAVMLSLIIAIFVFTFFLCRYLLGCIDLFNLFNSKTSFENVLNMTRSTFRYYFYFTKKSIVNYIFFPVLYIPCVLFSLVTFVLSSCFPGPKAAGVFGRNYVTSDAFGCISDNALQNLTSYLGKLENLTLYKSFVENNLKLDQKVDMKHICAPVISEYQRHIQVASQNNQKNEDIDFLKTFLLVIEYTFSKAGYQDLKKCSLSFSNLAMACMHYINCDSSYEKLKEVLFSEKNVNHAKKAVEMFVAHNSDINERLAFLDLLLKEIKTEQTATLKDASQSVRSFKRFATKVKARSSFISSLSSHEQQPHFYISFYLAFFGTETFSNFTSGKGRAQKTDDQGQSWSQQLQYITLIDKETLEKEITGTSLIRFINDFLKKNVDSSGNEKGGELKLNTTGNQP